MAAVAEASASSSAAADAEPGKVVCLVSNDGEKFEVNSKIISISELVMGMISDQEDDSSEMLEIPLPRVRSEILAKVIEYCQHYQEEPMTEIAKPLKANKMEEVVQDWYAKFVVDLSPDDLKSYITAANYMCIKPMQNLSCAMVAFMIKAKIPEEIANLPYK